MFSDRQYVAVSTGNLAIFTSKNKDGAQEKKRDKLGVHVANFLYKKVYVVYVVAFSAS